jgi:MoaA/NifB/PqqE/SkfB family radical SAM enzyme
MTGAAEISLRLEGLWMLTPEENFALTHREHDTGAVRVESSPALLTIESTSICNLRCVMCPHAIDAVDRPKHMPAEIIDRLKGPMGLAREAQLHGIGEPLASPAFWRALESDAFHPDCILNINTNLTILNDRRLALLMAARTELRLNISVDAATAETYSRIRGASFDEVTGNIRRLVAARGGGKRPAIYMNMTLMRENIEEAPAFVELAQALGADRVYLWQMNHWADEEMARYRIDRAGWHFDYAEQGLWNFPALSNRSLRAAQLRSEALGIPLLLEGLKDIFFAEPEPAAAPDPPTGAAATQAAVAVPAAPETVRDCRAPWEWALVSTDGDVRPCCFAPGTLGNLNQASFDEIWNGKEMQRLRGDLLAGVVNRICDKAVCKYVKNTEANAVAGAGPGVSDARPNSPKFVQGKGRSAARGPLLRWGKRVLAAGGRILLKIRTAFVLGG